MCSYFISTIKTKLANFKTYSALIRVDDDDTQSTYSCTHSMAMNLSDGTLHSRKIGHQSHLNSYKPKIIIRPTINLGQELKKMSTYFNYRPRCVGILHKHKLLGHDIFKREVKNPNVISVSKFIDSTINFSHRILLSKGCDLTKYDLNDISAFLHYGEKEENYGQGQQMIYISRKKDKYTFFRFRYQEDYTIDIYNPGTEYLEIRGNKVLDFSRNRPRIFHRENGKLYTLTLQGNEVVPSDEISFTNQYDACNIPYSFLPKKNSGVIPASHIAQTGKFSKVKNKEKYKTLIEYGRDWFISVQEDNSIETMTNVLTKKHGESIHELVISCINEKILPLFKFRDIHQYELSKIGNSYKLLGKLPILNFRHITHKLCDELIDQTKLVDYYDTIKMEGGGRLVKRFYKLVEDSMEKDSMENNDDLIDQKKQDDRIIKVIRISDMINSDNHKDFLLQLLHKIHVYSNAKQQEISTYAQTIHNADFENIDKNGNVLKYDYDEQDNISEYNYDILYDCILDNKLDIEKYIINDNFKPLSITLNLIVFFAGVRGFDNVFLDVDPVGWNAKNYDFPHSLQDITLVHRIIPNDVDDKELDYFMRILVKFCLSIEGARDNRESGSGRIFAYAHKYRNICNQIIAKNRKAKTLREQTSNTIALLEHIDFQIIHELYADILKEMERNPHREILNKFFQYAICTAHEQIEDIFSIKLLLDDIANQLRDIHDVVKPCRIEKNTADHINLEILFNKENYEALHNLLDKHDDLYDTSYHKKLTNRMLEYEKLINEPGLDISYYLTVFMDKFLKKDPVKGLCQHIKNQMYEVIKSFLDSETSNREKDTFKLLFCKIKTYN